MNNELFSRLKDLAQKENRTGRNFGKTRPQWAGRNR